MRPNIIYIMADDIGYGDFGCYGSSKIRTPNIDRVAQNGMRFGDMHSSAALCTPSRYSVLTGRYSWRTWLKSFVLGGLGAPLIDRELPTVASMLKGHRYETAAIGKWHLGLTWHTKDGTRLSTKTQDGWGSDGFDVDYTVPVEDGPLSHGFDYWFGIAGSLDMPPYCYIENNTVVEVPSEEKSVYLPQQRRGPMQAEWDDEQVDLIFADKAVDFIDAHVKRSATDPFFLYLTTSAPHRPCAPPPSFVGSSDAGRRGDMVTVYDSVVGKVITALERNRIVDDTLLIVTSDHGARLTDFDGRDYGHKANGDLRGGKGDIYEGGHRVPLVATWPKVIKAGTVSEELLCTMDLLSTCCEIVEETQPSNYGGDGRSFFSVLKGEPHGQPVHNCLVHHALDGMFAVRQGDWKLIMGLGSGGFSEPRRYSQDALSPPGQLYNLRNDSREFLNLWAGNTEIVEKLSFALREIQSADLTDFQG